MLDLSDKKTIEALRAFEANRICKNCTRYKAINPLEKLGTCVIVTPLFGNAPDIDKRIIHKEVIGFPFNHSKVFVGENFGCIHFLNQERP